MEEKSKQKVPTPFICDNCGLVGTFDIEIDSDIHNEPCPSCAEENCLDLNLEGEKGYLVTQNKFPDKRGHMHFVFDPAQLRKDIINAFNLLTFEGKTYKFDRVKKTYEPADIWLNKIIMKTIGDDVKDRHVKEVVSQIKMETSITEYPSPNPFDIPFNNGIFNTETWKFREYSAEDYFFHHLPINYTHEGACPTIDSFFETVVEGEKERQWLIDWASFMLVRPIITAKMLLITGYGSNGKSIYADILKSGVGKNLTTSISLHDLHDFAIEPLYVTRPYLNVSGELSRKKDLEQDIVKKLISGESVTLNRKNKSFVSFEPNTKFLTLSNELPENLRDLSDGWCRRILPMNFDRSFKEDESFRRKVTNIDEVSYWFSQVILPNLKEVITNKEISEALTPDEVRSFFNENMNSISAFCEEMLEYDANARFVASELQACYKVYCANERLRQSSNVALGRGIKKFFKNKLRLRWNEASPVELITARDPSGQESFTEAYRGIRLKDG